MTSFSTFYLSRVIGQNVFDANNQSIILNPTTPDINVTQKNGNIKYGFVINCVQAFNKDLGILVRASWNDGQNETWMFTEIDRSVSIGFNVTGNRWNRQNDNRTSKCIFQSFPCNNIKL